ncbi:protein gone early [Bacillus rossius redtenbacheri]|uniref:protein gone early n=1 Tax=Bacillus rossius redtenbacheri TaxID=93214 RepID=UPI002FDC9F1D
MNKGRSDVTIMRRFAIVFHSIEMMVAVLGVLSGYAGSRAMEPHKEAAEDKAPEAREALMDAGATRRAALAEWTRLGRGGQLAVLGLLLASVVLVVLLCCWPARSHQEDTPVCRTPACLLASAQVVRAMDRTSAEPCLEFRDFACGGSPPSAPELLVDSYEARLQRLLSRAVPPGRTRAVAWKTRRFYESCVALDAVEADGDRPLRALVRQLGGWGVLRDFSVLSWSYREQLVSLHARHGASPFFQVAVVPDPEQPSRAIVQISPAGLGLPDRSYYYSQHDNRTEAVYRRFLQNAVQELGATSADASSFGEEVFHFEKRLAEATPRADRPVLHRLSLAELAEKAPSIPLHDIISAKYPNARIEDSTVVLATSVSYLTQISNILTSSDREVLNNYMMWNYASQMLPHLSAAYRTVVQLFQEELTGRKQAPPRWLTCVRVLRRYMGLALAALHDGSVPAETRSAGGRAVNAMFENVHAVLKEAIRDSSFYAEMWRYALDKVDAMSLQVGLPARLQSDAFLEQHYADLSVQRNNFFQNVRYGAAFLRAAEEAQLLTPAEEDTWMSAMTDVDAVSYVPASNKVVVPQRLLVAPDFHPGYPPAVLYGRAGAQLAAAAVTAVLPWDALHASDGTLVGAHGAVGNATARLARAAQECLDAAPRAALRLLVETAALRLAFRACTKAVQQLDHIHQPALENLEDDALFFVAYAQSLCSRPESGQEYSGNTGTFQFTEKNMLELLLKNREFTETFKCKNEEYSTSQKCKRIL